MSIIVHQSKYAIATFEEERRLYTLKYLSHTKFMDDNDWKMLMTELKKITDKYKPVYILDDNTDRLYAYSPEIQEWTLKLFVEGWYNNGLKKYVQILPKEFISGLSAEQIVELANNSFTDIFENTFVTDEPKALQWLFDE